MFAERIALWTAALRSGKYEQGKGYLHTLGDPDKFCCLGVACQVYQAQVGGLSICEFPGGVTYDGCDHILPLKVADWFGLSTAGGSYGSEQLGSLWKLNDGVMWADELIHPQTFVQIADVIDSRPEGLFDGA